MTADGGPNFKNANAFRISNGRRLAKGFRFIRYIPLLVWFPTFHGWHYCLLWLHRLLVASQASFDFLRNGVTGSGCTVFSGLPQASLDFPEMALPVLAAPSLVASPGVARLFEMALPVSRNRLWWFPAATAHFFGFGSIPWRRPFGGVPRRRIFSAMASPIRAAPSLVFSQALCLRRLVLAVVVVVSVKRCVVVIVVVFTNGIAVVLVVIIFGHVSPCVVLILTRFGLRVVVRFKFPLSGTDHCRHTVQGADQTDNRIEQS